MSVEIRISQNKAMKNLGLGFARFNAFIDEFEVPWVLLGKTKFFRASELKKAMEKQEENQRKACYKERKNSALKIVKKKVSK